MLMNLVRGNANLPLQAALGNPGHWSHKQTFSSGSHMAKVKT
jgi:hypothetical protein